MYIVKLILPIALLFAFTHINAQVIINQVFYDTPLNEAIIKPPYSNGEFVELYNLSDSIVPLDGWQIKGDGKTEVYHFPANSYITPNGYLCLAYRHNSTYDFLLDSLIEVPLTNNIKTKT